MSAVECACAAAGYKVSVDEVKKFEDFQFLKMSPARDAEGEYHALLNLGVVLRASGCCRGDIPSVTKKKNRSIIEDAATFQSLLMSGMMSSFSHTYLEKLAPRGIKRDSASLQEARKYSNALEMVDHKDEEVHIYDDAIYERYELDAFEINELHSCILESTFGTVAYSRAVDKILTKDYGLRVPLQ